MREILFRAKRIDNGKGNWVFGNLRVDKYNPEHDPHGCPSRVETSIYVNDANKPWSGYIADVNPATVGQYTGLTDKNGTKIFEGDIVKITDDNDNTDFSDGGIGNVEFICGLWYVSGKPQNGLWDLMQGYYCEVIGNIHDNPELLEGTNVKG